MQICELKKDHYEELSVFLEGQSHGVFSRSIWMDRFPCFWDNNPSFKDGNDQRGWLIIDDDGRIGGIFGSVPMLYCYKGEERVFDIASSWYVAPSCRKHSLDVFRRFLKQDNAQLCTTPSPEVAFIFKKMGFKSFEAEWLNKEYILPINSWEFSYFLRKKLFKGKMMFTLSVCLMPLFSAIIEIYKCIHRLRYSGKKGKQYSIRETNVFGDEYGTFWEKFRVKSDVLAVRNQKALNWFFLGTPELKSQRIVLEIHRKQELIGYVAFKEVTRQVGAQKQIRFYEMVDAALLEESDELFLELLEELKLLAYKNKVSMIKMYAIFPQWESLMRKKGFMTVAKEHRFLYRNVSDHLPDLKTWLTPLDGDRGLF